VALDIRRDDLLTIGAVEYPVKAVAVYDQTGLGATAGLSRMARTSCSTKRYPEISGGKRSAAAVNLTGLKCTPLDPVDADTARRNELNTPYQLRTTFIGDGSSFAQIFVEVDQR
jgi:hypothetical protein